MHVLQAVYLIDHEPSGRPARSYRDRPDGPGGSLHPSDYRRLGQLLERVSSRTDGPILPVPADQQERLDRRRFASHAEVCFAAFDFIEGWYNSPRRHCRPADLSPLASEQRGVHVPTHETGATSGKQHYAVGLAIARILRRGRPAVKRDWTPSKSRRDMIVRGRF